MAPTLDYRKNPFLKNPSCKIFLIISPSGGGKSTQVKAALKHPKIGRSLEFVITHASRSPRGTEKNGVDYYFVDDAQFRRMVDADEFAEHMEVYPGGFYGTSRTELVRVVGNHNHGITDIDIKGATNLKYQFPGNVHTIFLQPESIEQTREQLELRSVEDGMTKGEIDTRMARFDEEFARRFDFELLVTNVHGKPEIAQKVIADFIHEKTFSGTHSFVC